VFSATLKDHNANVAKWRAIEKEMKAKAAGSPPPDAPATGSSKSQAVSRTPPSPADKNKAAAPAGPAQSAAPPARDSQDVPAWTSTTQPAKSPSKR
jgi:UPF0755 protein